MKIPALNAQTMTAFIVLSCMGALCACARRPRSLPVNDLGVFSIFMIVLFCLWTRIGMLQDCVVWRSRPSNGRGKCRTGKMHLATCGTVLGFMAIIWHKNRRGSSNSLRRIILNIAGEPFLFNVCKSKERRQKDRRTPKASPISRRARTSRQRLGVRLFLLPLLALRGAVISLPQAAIANRKLRPYRGVREPRGSVLEC